MFMFSGVSLIVWNGAPGVTTLTQGSSDTFYNGLKSVLLYQGVRSTAE